MTRFENPVFMRELRSRLRPVKFIPAMLLRCVCLGLIFLLMLLARLGRGILAFILAETLLILLFTPGAVCSAFVGSTRQRDLRDLVLTRLSLPAIMLGKLVAADLYTCMIVSTSSVVMCIIALFHSDLHVWRFICASGALLIVGFSSAMVGLGFAMIFRRNGFAAYMFAYLLIFLLIASVIVPGPLIDRTQSARTKKWMIDAALYANPLVMTSRALGTIDLMRTRYIYILAEPIVTREFTYPDWYFAGIIYLAASCLFLIPIFIEFRFRTRLPEKLIDASHALR